MHSAADANASLHLLFFFVFFPPQINNHLHDLITFDVSAISPLEMS